MNDAEQTILDCLQKVKFPAAVKDITGQRFGRLTVLKFAGMSKKRRAMFICRCDCGSEKIACGYHLRRGYSQSCGCLNLENSIQKLVEIRKRGDIYKPHGMCKTREYATWVNIRERCHNPENPSYERYGGRGIRVCKRWVNSFKNFLKDVGIRPPGMSLGRIDNDKGYEPGNVRWETVEQQANNKSNNVMLTINGETLTAAQWARKAGVKYDLVLGRIHRGYTTPEALFKPSQVRKGQQLKVETPLPTCPL